MAVKPKPDGTHTITPYLSLENADAFLAFVQKAFGAAEPRALRRPDGKVMHAEVKIGDSTIMVGECCQEMGAMPSGLYLYVEDTDATYKQALEAGATTVMEPTDMFWGDRMASVKDPCGNMWSIATHVEDVAPDEINRRAQAFMAQFA